MAAKKAGKLAGQTYVITGTLNGFERADARRALEALGANVSSSLSGKTTGVVVGENPGSKAAKGKKLGLKIINETAFKRLVGPPPARKKAAKKKVAKKKVARKKVAKKKATKKKTATKKAATRKFANKKAKNVASDADDRMAKVASLLASSDWDTVLVGCALFRSLDDDQPGRQLISAIEPAHAELVEEPGNMCVHVHCEYFAVEGATWEDGDESWKGGAEITGLDTRVVPIESDSAEGLAWAMACMKENYWDQDNCDLEDSEDLGGDGGYSFFHFDSNGVLCSDEPELSDGGCPDREFAGWNEGFWHWGTSFLGCWGDPSQVGDGELTINGADVAGTKARPLLCALALIAGVDFDHLPAIDVAEIRTAREKEISDYMKPANLKEVFAR